MKKKMIFFTLISMVLVRFLSAQNIEHILLQNWNNNHWEDLSTISYTYDGYGNIYHILNQNWSEFHQEWINNQQTDYDLNPDNTIHYTINQQWDTISSYWENVNKMMYAYNQSNDISTMLYQNWNINHWEDIMRETNAYDNNTFLVHKILEMWSSPNNAWNNSSQTFYTNKPNGSIDYYISQNWITNTSSWNNASKAIYVYNTNELTVSVTYQIWTNNNWLNSMKQTNTFDENHYLTYSLWQLWDATLNNWKNLQQINYFLNTDGTIDYYISQNWNTNSGIWVNSMKGIYTWDQSSFTSENTQSKIYTIFPNPATALITLKSEGLSERIDHAEIIGLDGRKYSTFWIDLESIEISGLPSGNYVLVLSNGGKTYQLTFTKIP